MAELRNIAINSQSLSSGTMTRMKRSAILLGLQRKLIKSDSKVSDFEEEDWDWNYDLKKADELVIADDTLTHQIFGDKIWISPQEDILEGELQSFFKLRRRSDTIILQACMVRWARSDYLRLSNRNIKLQLKWLIIPLLNCVH
jgi:hypothetical protein